MPCNSENGIFTVLFFGDVSGDAGLRALRFMLPNIKKQYCADAVIVNGENSDGGYGISEKSFASIKESGVDVVTLGNHALEKEEIYSILDQDKTLLRPHNFLDGNPGTGYGIYEGNGVKYAVLNIHTRSGIASAVDCPYKATEKALKQILKETPIVIVDLHGEECYEKEAYLFAFKGQVSLILGTHTHVQTDDDKIASGTGYITDVGMCGAIDSVIGGSIEASIERARTCLPMKIPAVTDRAVLMGIKATIDVKTGKCLTFEKISIDEEE